MNTVDILWTCNHSCCIASSPTITPRVKDDCVLEGQSVTLTCTVTYNGTNLMPMVMYWYEYAWHNSRGYWRYDNHRTSLLATNVSSLHETSLTFTATGQTIGDVHQCRVSFSFPTGLVLHGVQKQYSNSNGLFESSPFVSRTVASE